MALAAQALDLTAQLLLGYTALGQHTQQLLLLVLQHRDVLLLAVQAALEPRGHQLLFGHVQRLHIKNRSLVCCARCTLLLLLLLLLRGNAVF